MKLTEKQKRHLKKLAHSMKPVVMVGQHGLTESVIREIDLSIAHHELIKVRISGAEREDKNAIIDDICGKIEAELIQKIGHVAVFFRRADKPVIDLPKK